MGIYDVQALLAHIRSERKVNTMAMKGIHQAQSNLTKNASQPGGTKIVHETNENKRSVPALPSHEKGEQKLKEGNLTANASQPSGSSIGYKTGSQGSESKSAGSFGSGGGIFKTRGSVLRNSGVAGAHRIGCRK